jgi:malonyl-CoA O-methyltransferase
VSTPPAAPLKARDAYRSWAATYDDENALSTLEDEAARSLTPCLPGKTLLDAACGTGRRIRSISTRAVGVDLVYEMLTAEKRDRAGSRLVNADLHALPFADRTFDVIWCRLVLGHLPELGSAYAELSRVCVPDAAVVVTDFHPAAARAGHVRSFRDESGVRHVVEHYIHETADHEHAAARAGLRLVRSLEPTVGQEIRSFYAATSALDVYEAQVGLALVNALLFAR